MSANSKIEWTDHTFNPWIGCTKVSPGCANCYAETQNQFRGWTVGWGKGVPRRRTSEANWKQPLKWNKHGLSQFRCSRCGLGICTCGHAVSLAPGAYPRPRVFCASLADWLDDEVPIEWLADLLVMIHATPNLDWLMLTKRPENWRKRIERCAGWFPREWANGNPPKNVWIGTTVENQEMADKRIPKLLSIPAKVRFLSCEPLLSQIDLALEANPPPMPSVFHHRRPDWVICGGESGPKARPMHPDWARSLRDQCAAAGVPFLFKQWGEWISVDQAKHVEDDLPLTKSYKGHKHPDGTLMLRVGKAKSGRLLDGREHNEFPKGGAA